MSDLVKREDVIEALYEAIRTDLKGTFTDSMSLAIAMGNNIPSAAPERTAKVTLIITGLHSVWGTCECGREVEKPGRNDQRGAYYCPRCGAKLEWE